MSRSRWRMKQPSMAYLRSLRRTFARYTLSSSRVKSSHRSSRITTAKSSTSKKGHTKMKSLTSRCSTTRRKMLFAKKCTKRLATYARMRVKRRMLQLRRKRSTSSTRRLWPLATRRGTILRSSNRTSSRSSEPKRKR